MSSRRSSAAFYQASLIRRRRASAAEVEHRRQGLLRIVAEQQPMTVRQIFYRASVQGLVDKSEGGYSKVQTDLVWLRRAGELPYRWLTDSTRWQRKPRTFGGVEEALNDTANLYRRALWRDVNAYAEIWLEKDALSGVIYPVTAEFDVPLMTARGYASLSFLSEAAEYIRDLTVPVFLYHLGDYDPSGVDAAAKIEKTIRELAPEAEVYFERLAVLPAQIARWNLPSRPTKQSDSRSKGFGKISVELDAIAPDRLRQLVQRAIQRHISPRQLKVLRAAEENERRLLRGLVGMMEGGAQ